MNIQEGKRSNVKTSLELFTWMIFCHFIFDCYFQTNKTMKNKQWWKKRHDKSMKQYNYLIGLMIHSFVWSFGILLPFTFVNKELNYVLLIMNTLIHAIVDNLKTNEKRLSSVQDQILHIVQIIITFLCIQY